jgi:hypothetical protein
MAPLTVNNDREAGDHTGRIAMHATSIYGRIFGCADTTKYFRGGPSWLL